MTKTHAIIALAVFAVATATHAQDATQKFDPKATALAVSLADRRATRLRERAQFSESVADAQVRVLISWGSGIDYETSIAAFREGVGHWRIEHVYNGGNMDAYSRGMVKATTSYLSPESAAKLDALLRDPALYDEPIYKWGYVAPQGATISIRFDKHARDAVFEGELSGASLTIQIIDIVDENNTPRLQAK